MPKTAFYAIEILFEELGHRLPVMASVTFIQKNGDRGVTGQTLEAFWNSISHFDLLSVGINCALGPAKMRPYVQELSKLAPVYISCHPNAGLPNAFGEYDQSPQAMAAELAPYINNAKLNIVGGCCGSTPQHIAALKALSDRASPRPLATATHHDTAAAVAGAL